MAISPHIWVGLQTQARVFRLVFIKERVHIYVNTLYIGIVIMCDTFHHCIVYNPKCINTKGLLVYQSFITIIQKTISLILTWYQSKTIIQQPSIIQKSSFPTAFFKDFSLKSGSLLLANIKNIIYKFLPFITIKNVISKYQEHHLPNFFPLWTTKNFIILLHLHPNLLSLLWR